MLNTFKIFPAIDLRNGRCVRLLQGDYTQETVYGENPSEIAKKWHSMGGDFLHVVDLDGAKAGHPVNLSAVKSITEKGGIPVEIGGGIRTLKDAEIWFDCGVSRVIVGTAALRNPQLVEDLINEFGADHVVLGLDAKNNQVAVSGWLEMSQISPVDLAKKFAIKGIKRLIFTDIATDGMMQGPNLSELSKICEAVPSMQVIASGGVSSVQDIIQLKNLNKINLEGAIVGKAIYEDPCLLPLLLEEAKR